MPYWARGRKISLLLQAILSPIVSVHNKFKSWALERYIECHITAQKLSIEWYLKYKLKSHFLNENDNFLIIHGISEADTDLESQYTTNMHFTCINTGIWRNNMFWSNELLWFNEDNDLIYDLIKMTDQTYIYAPAIVTTITYGAEDYERDIRNIMSKFMTNFSKVNIIVMNRNY